MSSGTNFFIAQATYQVNGNQYVSNVNITAVWTSSKLNIAQMGDPGHNTNADNNGDGEVNGKDYLVVTKNMGNIYGPYSP